MGILRQREAELLAKVTWLASSRAGLEHKQSGLQGLCVTPDWYCFPEHNRPVGTCGNLYSGEDGSHDRTMNREGV